MHTLSDEGVAGISAVGEPLPHAGPVAALPVIDGPSIEGLPADPRGFLPIDEHCRVRGVDDVYAAGDGTDFPVKQGGIATQEADAAAAHVAAAVGAALEPQPFRPVLRGMLFTKDSSLSMRSPIAGGAGEGVVSPGHLWWPPEKIAGRYLNRALGTHELTADLPSGEEMPLEVEVSLPHEWHATPGLPGAVDH
jgi:sulfide:quinone oxidoreductase